MTNDHHKASGTHIGLERGHTMRRHQRFSGFSLLVAFAGGALAGAAVGYPAVPENRARLHKLAQGSRDWTGRIPRAFHDASNAAKDAFADAYRADATKADVVEPSHARKAPRPRNGRNSPPS